MGLTRAQHLGTNSGWPPQRKSRSARVARARSYQTQASGRILHLFTAPNQNSARVTTAMRLLSVGQLLREQLLALATVALEACVGFCDSGQWAGREV
jgi:hypothetical protein